MSDNVVERGIVEEMDVAETVVELTPDQGCGETSVDLDQSDEKARDPVTTLDKTHEAEEITAALDEDCLEIETSDDEIYEYDPEETPDAAQVTNNILKETVIAWRDNWDLNVEAEPNYFSKINEIRNYDPLRERADKTSEGKFTTRRNLLH